MADVLLRRRALGDVVLVGAVAAALPGVTVVTEERFRPIVERLRGVARVLPWSEAGRVRGEVVDLQGSWSTALAHPFARRIGKHSLRRRWRLAGWSARRPAVTDLYARACGVVAVPPPWLERAGGDALALIPGASTPLKQWDPSGYVAVGRAFSGQVVVLGGPDDRALVEAVVASVPGATALVEHGFEATIAALGRCSVAVGGDTGLLHLAAAAGAVPVALLGPTHPDDGFFPYGGGVALGLELPCRPCTLHRGTTCRLVHRGCMDLDARRVLEAVDAARGSR